MKKIRRVVALIPCYNEESGIVDVINKFPYKALKAHGYQLEVLVVDNNSTDRTAEVAAAAGARVIHEPKQGKGAAIQTGFRSIGPEIDYVVMLDGDDTYRASEVMRLLEPIDSGFADVIIGSRMHGRIKPGSMKTFNYIGNRLYSRLVRTSFKVHTSDVLTGYFAWRRDVIVRLWPHLRSKGFAIEMEMITKMAKLGYQIFSVPISYEPRAGESSLHPVRDGSRILWMYLKAHVWSSRDRRIAFVSDSIYPYNKGGKEKRLYELSRRLVREGREVHIYTMKWWDGPSTIEQNGVSLHAITKLHPLYNQDRRSISEAVWFGLGVLKLLWHRFDVLDVDSIPVLPLFSARLVTWMRLKPLIATWHEVWGMAAWREYLPGMTGHVAGTLEWLALHMGGRIISVSHFTTARLRAAGIKLPIQTVPLGVDLNGIYVIAPSTTPVDILYVGRLLKHKNVDLLIEAVARVRKTYPAISVQIIGNGPEKPRLEALVARRGLEQNVRFVNFVDHHEEVYGQMKASKMLVLPSVREGFGLVVVEANACDIPVITIDHVNNAARNLITPGKNGYLARPTAPSIARRIVQVLESDGSLSPRDTLGDEYDWAMVAANLEQSLNG